MTQTLRRRFAAPTPAEPDGPGPSNIERIRAFLPLHSQLHAGLVQLLGELKDHGIPQAEIVRRANAELARVGLREGLDARTLAGLKTRRLAITLERLAQLQASRLIDVDDLLAWGDGLPSRSELATVLVVLLAALDAAKLLEQLATDPSVALPVREALRVRPGAVQLHERARALDLRVAEASTLRRGDGQIVAGVVDEVVDEVILCAIGSEREEREESERDRACDS